MKAGLPMAQPVRATQKLVDQMGWVLRRPSLTAIEIAWHWLFGAPFLWVCYGQAKKILTALPPSYTGLSNLDTQNPWVAVVQLADAWSRYAPYVAHSLHWLVPTAAIAWIVASGVGRGLVLKLLEPGFRFRPLAMMALQAGWLVLLGLVFWGWFHSIQWVAATHIAPDGDADLVGYSIWAIFLSLGFFTLWALISWPFAVAPMLMLLEKRSAASAFVASFGLGRAFTSKLMEINLVMGIVKLALIVLAMVFSAAPLPFSDELGPDAMHFVWAGSTLFYLVVSDYFHVVRLKSFIEFWRTFRG
ncbi:MAG: hypothetical protein WB679_24060 [Terracidiphilus sp.]